MTDENRDRFSAWLNSELVKAAIDLGWSTEKLLGMAWDDGYLCALERSQDRLMARIDALTK